MIESDRLFIRPIEPKDSQPVFSYRSDKQTNKFQNWIPETGVEVDAFIAKNPKSFIGL